MLIKAYLFLAIECDKCMLAGHDWRVEPSVTFGSFKRSISLTRPTDFERRSLLAQKYAAFWERKIGRRINARERDQDYAH